MQSFAKQSTGAPASRHIIAQSRTIGQVPASSPMHATCCTMHGPWNAHMTQDAHSLCSHSSIGPVDSMSPLALLSSSPLVSTELVAVGPIDVLASPLLGPVSGSIVELSLDVALVEPVVAALVVPVVALDVPVEPVSSLPPTSDSEKQPTTQSRAHTASQRMPAEYHA